MTDLMNYFLAVFSALFFTIDSLGVIPIFISLTADATEQYKRKMAKKGALTAFFILLFFAVTGSFVMNSFGISVPAFRIAGGILLLLLAIDMVLANSNSPIRNENEEEKQETARREDISVFPIAIPLLSGPAAITLLILFMKQAEGFFEKQILILLALIINMLVCWLGLVFANQISKVLGKSGINVVTRIFGILLTALACQLFIDGVTEAFHIID
jgi:multiple antibiotic resistance protein